MVLLPAWDELNDKNYRCVCISVSVFITTLHHSIPLDNVGMQSGPEAEAINQDLQGKNENTGREHNRE